MITIIKNDDNNFCQYPNQTSPQRAYIELDCASDSMSSGYNSDIGYSVPFSVFHGHDQRFGISEYLTVESINALLEELKRPAQIVCEGYSTEYDGNNNIAKFTVKAEVAINIMFEICETYQGETFSVYTWEEWLENNDLLEILEDYKTIEEAEESLLKDAKENLCEIIDSKDLTDCLAQKIEEANFEDLQRLPEKILSNNSISSAICESFEEELENYLSEAIEESDHKEFFNSIEGIKAYSSICPKPYSVANDYICELVLDNLQSAN